ncbi:hypothetical protein A0H81_09605 [Grifola frondosa]|uniref:Uncharacterized protein n=1 Tax=Grifola frondosa TaxID=5627 RepID=A0A1C7M045_GRIFR|nr:hypothetical protein A0H81_09605 [Grifola frondosa]
MALPISTCVGTQPQTPMAVYTSVQGRSQLEGTTAKLNALALDDSPMQISVQQIFRNHVLYDNVLSALTPASMIAESERTDPAFRLKPKRQFDESLIMLVCAHLREQQLVGFLVSAASRGVPSNNKGKGKLLEHTLTEEECVVMVSLSLSDHSIWSDPDLRRMIDESEEGWIPLNYLGSLPPLSSLSSRPLETVLAKSIRGHASDILEVRMRVTSPSRSVWYGKHKMEDEAGGYEIRRKDWEAALETCRNFTRQDWELRTVYMENIPLQYRTIPGIFLFTTKLLSKGQSALPVQKILLPPHHHDHPGDHPKCKGFALVTLARTQDAERLLEQWPWDVWRSIPPLECDSSTAEDAVKFGFRTLSKSRWDVLKEEYLAYRHKLLAIITQEEVEQQLAATEDSTDVRRSPPPPTLPAAEVSVLDASAPFPPGCLVFVRNIHPDTNKTTLRTLFSAHAFGSGASGLDYVDFNKGMETCYLRLATASHTGILEEAFRTRPVAQMQGLDSTGSLSSSGKAISIEIVDGTREEIYWSKVPEKVRREAVQKAISLSSTQSADYGNAQDIHDSTEGKRKRKRRKHNS